MYHDSVTLTNKFVWQFTGGTKKHSIFAGFKSVEKVAEKSPKKVINEKVIWKMEFMCFITGNVIQSFWLIIFFMNFLATFSRIWNLQNILPFWYPDWFFGKNKIIGTLLPLLGMLGAKCTQNSYKKTNISTIFVISVIWYDLVIGNAAKMWSRIFNFFFFWSCHKITP